ncbi:MAG TPA: hypothetical protein VJW17_00350 [Pyrinomonadaceae bacterium]|nr:hypothetical protein [Pyrinomonadaceae bacterium]
MPAKRMNQPPTGQGKKQSPRSGAQHKLEKRSEVLQAAGARQNTGTADDEEAVRGPARANPKRAKAGR